MKPINVHQQIKKVLNQLGYLYSVSDKETTIYSLKFKNELSNNKEIVYEVDMMTSEILGNLRFYVLDFITLENKCLDKVKNLVNVLNKQGLYGSLFYDEEDSQITIGFKHTISLNRDNQCLTDAEVEDIFSYINFIIELIYDDLKGNKNE